MQIKDIEIVAISKEIKNVVLEEDIFRNREALDKIYYEYYNIFEKGKAVIIKSKTRLFDETDKISYENKMNPKIEQYLRIISDNISDMAQKLESMFGYEFKEENDLVKIKRNGKYLEVQLYFYQLEDELSYYANLKKVDFANEGIEFSKIFNVLAILKEEFVSSGIVVKVDNIYNGIKLEDYRLPFIVEKHIKEYLYRLKYKTYEYSVVKYSDMKSEGEVYCRFIN